MTDRDWHQVWVEQCAAAETIKLWNGLKAAFDYAVAEKLLNFAVDRRADSTPIGALMR